MVALSGKRRLEIEEENKGPTITMSVHSPSTVATDYLVPLSMVEQRQTLQMPQMTGNNPVYLSGVRQERTTLGNNPVYLSGVHQELSTLRNNPVYLSGVHQEISTLGNTPVYLSGVHQELTTLGNNLSGVRQELTTLWLRQQQREGLEHSYETMTHDYEDIFMESLNGGVANPVLMKANEAYTIPRTLSYNPCRMLSLS